MQKTRTVKTSYQLDKLEITLALREYVIKELNLQQDLLDHKVELDVVVDRECELDSLQITFTKTDQKKLDYKLNTHE